MSHMDESRHTNKRVIKQSEQNRLFYDSRTRVVIRMSLVHESYKSLSSTRTKLWLFYDSRTRLVIRMSLVHESYKSLSSTRTRLWLFYDSQTRLVIRMGHVTHANKSCHTFEWVTSHIWINHVTHMNESCYTQVWVMNTYKRVTLYVLKKSCHA